MKFVTEMGRLYRLTNKAWGRFLEDRQQDHVSVSEYGTLMGPYNNVTDWQADDATMELEMLTR